MAKRPHDPKVRAPRRPALSTAAAIAADALADLVPGRRALAMDEVTASDVVAPVASGNLGGHYLGERKRGPGNLGGYYLGPLSRELRRAQPAPPVEVATATGSAQIPQSEVNNNPNSQFMSDTKKTTTTTAGETIPGHDKTVKTETVKTEPQPETKVETKTETTEKQAE